MDIAKASKFLYNDGHKIYVSKSLDSFYEKCPYFRVGSCMAIVDTDAGPILYEMDTDYSGEPIIMRKFMHYKSYRNYFIKDFIEI